MFIGHFAVGLAGKRAATLDGVGRWAFAGFVALALILYALGFGPPPKEGQQAPIAGVGLAVVAIFVALAAWTDRHRASR